MMIKIVALDHLQLAMPRGKEAEARGFYSQLLGLAEIQKPSALAPRGGCWFRGNGVTVHLGVAQDFAPAKKAHPAFVVTDLETCRQAVQSAGLRVVPDDAVPGVRRFYTDDPFGNRIEFIQQGDSF